MAIYSLSTSGNAVELFVEDPPYAHRILCPLPTILSGHSLYGGWISDLIALPARSVYTTTTASWMK